MFQDCFVKIIALCTIWAVVDAVDVSKPFQQNTISSSAAASRVMRSETGQPLAFDEATETAFSLGAELSMNQPDTGSLASHSKGPDEISKKMLNDLKAARKLLSDVKQNLKLAVEKAETPCKEETTTTAPCKEETTTTAPCKEETTTTTPCKEETTTTAPCKEETTKMNPCKEETTTTTPCKEETTTMTPCKEETTTMTPCEQATTTTVTEFLKDGSAEGTLDACLALAPNLAHFSSQAKMADVKRIFPVRRQGFCVNSNGQDVNESATNLAPDWDICTEEDIECCLRMCYRAAVQSSLNPASIRHKPVTGCEIIWNQTNKGCYVHHSSEITQGNGGHPRYLCWIADLDVLSEHVDTLKDVTPLPPILPSQDASEQSQPDVTVTKSVKVGSTEGNLDACRALAPNFEDVKRIFPVRRQGFCVNSNGQDVNESATNLAPDWDICTEEDIECCLRICYRAAVNSRLNPAGTNYQPVTGCEIIWNQTDKGCYVHHSSEITQGNGGHPRHLCWIADLDVLSEHADTLKDVTPLPPIVPSQEASEQSQPDVRVTNSAGGLESKLNSLDKTLAELRLQNHMFDQGLDTAVHMKKMHATWQKLQN